VIRQVATKTINLQGDLTSPLNVNVHSGVKVDSNYVGGGISIAGTSYEKGLMMHTESSGLSEASYAVPEGADTLRFILVEIISVPSLTSNVNSTWPLKFSSGVTEKVPSSLSMNLNVSLEASETQIVTLDPIADYPDIDSNPMSYQSVERDVMLDGVVVGTVEIVASGESYSTNLLEPLMVPEV
jgi:hypothetical protein